MDTSICMAESLCYLPETITTLLISYSPIKSLFVCLSLKRISLSNRGTWVQFLVWENSTCLGETKPVHLNYCVCTLESVLCNKRNHHSEKPVWDNQSSLCSMQREGAHAQNVNKLKKKRTSLIQ